MSPEHRADLDFILSFIPGKKDVAEVLFKSKGTFTAITMAEKFLAKKGYRIGSMCGREPIAFAKSNQIDYIAKWKNISTDEYHKIDGVILPDTDFREGNSIVYFFGKES